MVEALSYHLRDTRVTMRLNEEVESVEETPDGGVVANLESKKKISGDALLYAVGRQGNVDELNLAAAGIEADSRGRIPVDAELPDQAAEYLRGGRRDRLPQPGFGLHGTGPHCRRAAPSATAGALQSGILSVRNLHDPGDLVHRQDRRATHG